MLKIEFPEEIKLHILSYLPITPRFKFDTSRQCELHKILYKFMYGPCASSTTLYISLKTVNYFKLYLNNYYLKDNNYLQNENGDTPLHIAYYYRNNWAISLLESKVPKMKLICNNNGLSPRSMWNYYDTIPQEIHYPQEMTDFNMCYLARY